MKVKSYVILLMAAFSFAACKKDPGQNPGPGIAQQGKDAKITLKIKQAKGLTTYAPGDLNSTDAEATINRVDVFIFDDGAPYGLIHRFFDDPADIYNTPGDLSAGLKPLDLEDVKTGTKRIYIGINLTTAIIDRLIDNYSYLTDGIIFNAGASAPYNTDQLLEHLIAVTGTPGTNDANLVMFNTSDFDNADPLKQNIITITEAGPNAITVDVSRMVAKVAVKTDPNLDLHVPGGTLSDLRFTAGQSNNRLHLAPLRQFRDANWATFQAFDFNQSDVDSVLQSYANGIINPANDDWGDFDFEDEATPKVYLPENTSQTHKHNEVSFISLMATFTPTDDGEPLGFGTTPQDLGAFPAGTFYAVFTNDPGSVLSPVPGIAAHYFSVEADADAYATAHDGVKLTYTNGRCYYRIYLNAAGNGTTTGNPYDVLRNVFYKVNITRINTIGTVHPDHIPGAEGTPGYPGDPDAGGPIPVVASENPAVLATHSIDPPKNADITTTITIADWDPQGDDYEF